MTDGVEFVIGEVDRVDAEASLVTLLDGRRLDYDYLVIASGTSPRPDQTEGMLGEQWRRSVFDFSTLDGSKALGEALKEFDHGRLAVHITEMPIKCPVAPLEFTFLAESWLRQRGIRDRVELVFVTPLPGAFTKPIASAHLGSMLDERKIHVETFDLLVTVPLNMGADFVERSGLGDQLNYVPVDRHTLLSKAHDHIFAVGDASDIPASKAGSVAHFSVEVFVDNFLEAVAGRPMTGTFDGHANCFVESGDRKALLIDFNYDTEPLPGKYPLPVVGPLDLLKETRANHLGKLAFRWIYWNVLLPGRPVPLPTTMIDSHEIHVDDEGFMTEYDEWSEDLGKALAAQIGIEMTGDHWKAVRFLREDFPEQGETATIRRVSVVGQIPTKTLFQLFPQKPAKKMAYIAGLPKPHGCV